jgi:hypothetical protein
MIRRELMLLLAPPTMVMEALWPWLFSRCARHDDERLPTANGGVSQHHGPMSRRRAVMHIANVRSGRIIIHSLSFAAQHIANLLYVHTLGTLCIYGVDYWVCLVNLLVGW